MGAAITQRIIISTDVENPDFPSADVDNAPTAIRYLVDFTDHILCHTYVFL